MALDRVKMIAAIAGGLKIAIYKSSITTLAASYLCSTWRATGSPQWPQGAIPGAASNPTDDTVGGVVLPTFGTNIGRIYRWSPICSNSGTLLLYDRIGHMGGLSGTVTTPQTVNLAVETPKTAGRCRTDYKNIEWYAEIYTAIGTTAANLTVTYTDSADTSGKTVVLTGFSGASPLNSASRCVLIMPTDGIAIKSVQSVQLSGTTGTAGSFGITARVQVTSVGQYIANVIAPAVDAISIGLPEVKDTVCLELLVNCTTTSSGVVTGDFLIGNIAET